MALVLSNNGRGTEEKAVEERLAKLNQILHDARFDEESINESLCDEIEKEGLKMRDEISRGVRKLGNDGQEEEALS